MSRARDRLPDRLKEAFYIDPLPVNGEQWVKTYCRGYQPGLQKCFICDKIPTNVVYGLFWLDRFFHLECIDRIYYNKLQEDVSSFNSFRSPVNAFYTDKEELIRFNSRIESILIAIREVLFRNLYIRDLRRIIYKQICDQMFANPRRFFCLSYMADKNSKYTTTHFLDRRYYSLLKTSVDIRVSKYSLQFDQRSMTIQLAQSHVDWWKTEHDEILIIE